ncbi:nitrogenase molybdenum-iron cofactor biosynthesis protein [Geobacter pelophilus]|uniref:Nitrogenase molybdenum-iron cofactor biosynthesis protein n=1 Tax=Geoanaerobacter pelophilus TaxID=60036 RepID=A0AAW4L9X5_9BACT|nr:NifB/NifX family molybdenum-iron cluster-binding protein [Geoanaerobacter pelophilus]MBT0665136.1 nitrogenase molybdenum-iron cofactor biosynthesis protein [Geoanaerobacter pelophilus]
MKFCFPIINNAGAATMIYSHFASAPQFLVIDTRNAHITVIPNCDRANPYAGCNPFSALCGQDLDAVIVDAIGDDAVRAMNMCGFKVFRAGSASVAENLTLFDTSGLTEVPVLDSHLEGRCQSGASGHSCGHHHH